MYMHITFNFIIHFNIIKQAVRRKQHIAHQTGFGAYSSTSVWIDGQTVFWLYTPHHKQYKVWHVW